MAFINGQWVDDNLLYGGTFDSPGLRPEPGSMTRPGFPSLGDWNPPPLPPTPPTWTQGPPFMPGPQPPFGDRPGMPNLPPQMNPPGYSRGPQMQPSPPEFGSAVFHDYIPTPGGMLGNIDQWNPVQTPEFQPFPQPLQWQPPVPPQMEPPMNIPPRMPAPQVRPPMPPPPPTIGDVWPQVDSPPVGSTIIDLIDTGQQDTRTQQELNAADHAFNVAQRERTKVR